MEETQTKVWYIVLAFVTISAALGTFAFIWYTSQQNSVAYQPLPPDTSTPRPAATRTPQPSASPTGDPVIEVLKNVSTSDAIEDIEKDIDNTKLENLDTEIQEIEKLLQ